MSHSLYLGDEFPNLSIHLILLGRLKKERRDREDVGKIRNVYSILVMSPQEKKIVGMLTTFWQGVLKRRNCLEFLGVGGIIMQLFVVKKFTVLAGTESNCFGESLTLSRLNLFCKNSVCTSQEIHYVSATKIPMRWIFSICLILPAAL